MRPFLALILCAVILLAQNPPPQNPPPQNPPAQTATPPAQTATPTPTVSTGMLNLTNASLTEVVDSLCRAMKINCIVDPRVKGSVTLNTYGETKQVDARNLLDMILRLNGHTMVQVGDFFRIVPMAEASRLPLKPTVDAASIPEDDQLMLNLVFLKYATVTEVEKIIEPFIGEGAKTISYAPANLLMILDSRRQIRRTMELIGLFDSDTLASQRVRLFEVKNGSPTEIAKEVEDILKSISLSGSTSVVRFMPVDRINTIIAVAPNPGVFDEVAKWIQKLDTEIKVTAGAVDVYVYRVRYGRAEIMAMAIMQLFGGYGMGFGGMGGYGGMGGMGYGGGGYGGMGYPGTGGYSGMGYPGTGAYGRGGGGYGGGGYGGGYGGGLPGGMYPGAGMMGGSMGFLMPGGYAPQGAPAAQAGAPGAAGTRDQTGSYLGAGGYGAWERVPRVIPNPMDNTLLIQGTPQEYQQILKLLRQLDIPPRQVLIDAKIYEVTMTGAFASGVAAFLQKRSGAERQLTADFSGATTLLRAGTLVGQSRELLAALSLAENATKARTLATPSIIATDSIPATISVGSEVPVLASQAVTGVQQGGSSLFANTISSRRTGVNFSILARVNPSGIVTLEINQEVSAPQAPEAGSIQSPSFSSRQISTQVTVQDGDTVAIGGIISESNSSSSEGIPVLHRLPVVGSLFGSKSYSKDRSELVMFVTPRVIYDLNAIIDASEEVKSRLKELRKYVKE